jgi:argininosuccinate lyase
MLKGLPLAYNKDMQEDKEAIFDSVDTVKNCLDVFTPMLATMKTLPENMYKAAQSGFINATDLADYLTKKGMPFRAAYKMVGQLVAVCMERGCVLDTLPMDVYQSYSDLFEKDLKEAICLETCVAKRISAGGTGFSSVRTQIQAMKEWLAADTARKG